jgi:pyruvate dehydrogenase E1 component alpha subunit
MYDVVSEAVDRARQGSGPTLIEASTFRMHGHAEGIEKVFGKAATEDEFEVWRARDPILRLRLRLEEARVDPSKLSAIEDAAMAEMEAAVEFAKASPIPEAESAFEDMWS